MKCIQPYIAQAGKFGQQILRSHFWSLSNPNLSQQIASKYSSFKGGKFPVATLMLQQTSHENTVSNTIQIFRTRVINVLPATNQINVNLKLFGYENAPIQRLEKKLFRNCVVNSATIIKNSQILSQRLANTIALNTVRWLERATFSNFTFVPLSPNAEVSKEWRTALADASRSQLVMKTRLDLNPKLIPQLTKTNTNRLLNFVSRSNKNQETNYSSDKQNIELRPKFSALSGKSNLKAYPLDNQSVNLIASNSNRAGSSLAHRVTNFANKNGDRHWTPDISAKLTKTQTSLLIDAVTTNWNISTFERKFGLWTKKDNLQPQPVLKAQKTALDSSNELKMASRQIRTKRFNQLANELILRRTNPGVADRLTQQKHYPFSQTTMELAQSPPTIKPTSSIQQSQKEIKKGWQQAKPTNIDSHNIDVNGIAERVFQVIERKLKVERQRRGIL